MPMLYHFLALSALLFGAGIAAMLLKRNPLGILMGIELMLNAATLNFVAFQSYAPQPLGPPGRADAQAFVLFIIVAAAAQAALAVAIFLNFYQSFRRMDVERRGPT